MTGTGLVALLIAAIPTLLLAIYTIEIVAGLRPFAPSRHAADAGPLPRTVVLIPAHNEAAGIGATLAALRAITDPAVELLVVADNCSDDTASCARAAGAQVVERHDPSRRGKGYALAFGRDALAAAPPACVVVLDADCAVAGAGIAALARATTAADRAHQACNLQRHDRTASPTAQISSFAFLVKNLVRQRGMVRVGGVAAMTGTGMAVPWAQFAEAPLASADLAEDMALGVWLTRSGHPPRFSEQVEIWSDAASGSALATQRHRWERGLLSIARRAALPLVASGFARRSRGALWLGLHIMVPPLALLFAGGGAAFLLTLLLAAVGAGFGPSLVLALALCCAGVATIAAWAAAGRDQIGGAELLRIPLYVVGKLPLYRMMLHRRGRDDWVRTRRVGETDEL